ncbi:MAG: hypothetical protein CME32_25860 [Gimesia sp.]|nr:hypothetical protein [Gimesia sp.]
MADKHNEIQQKIQRKVASHLAEGERERRISKHKEAHEQNEAERVVRALAVILSLYRINTINQNQQLNTPPPKSEEQMNHK